MVHRYKITLDGDTATIAANSVPHAWIRFLNARTHLDGVYGYAIPSNAIVTRIDAMGPSELHQHLVGKHSDVAGIQKIVAGVVLRVGEASANFSSDELRIMAEALVSDKINSLDEPTTAVQAAYVRAQNGLDHYRNALMNAGSVADWRAVQADLEHFEDVLYELRPNPDHYNSPTE